MKTCVERIDCVSIVYNGGFFVRLSMHEILVLLLQVLSKVLSSIFFFKCWLMLIHFAVVDSVNISPQLNLSVNSCCRKVVLRMVTRLSIQSRSYIFGDILRIYYFVTWLWVCLYCVSDSTVDVVIAYLPSMLLLSVMTVDRDRLSVLLAVYFEPLYTMLSDLLFSK